jgi:hypothetical protein
VPCDSRVFFKSLEVLKTLDGIRERTNKNDGVRINEIQRVGGLRNGDPYCNATMYYMFYQSVRALNLDINYIPIPKSGLAQSSFTYAVKNGVKTPYRAEIGDLLVWRRGNTGFGHIERVMELRAMGWVITLGGNVSTTLNGKRVEGIFYKKRHLSNPLSNTLQTRGLVGFQKISNVRYDFGRGKMRQI